MRFITFVHQGAERAGILLGDGPRARVLDGAHPRRPAPLDALAPDMVAWVGYGLSAIADALQGQDLPDAALLPFGEVALCAPLPRPGKIVGAAFNYRDGLASSARPGPEQPVIFVKSSSTVVGPEAEVRVVADADTTYEAELAVVIGRQALKVPRAEAMACVAGYTLFNDISATRYVREDGGFVRGKNQPTSGPLGPWIVTPAQVPDPYDLPIQLELDGRVLQDSRTGQMLHRIDALIEFISAQMPLEPGDVIATGTPAGVAAHHAPPEWLRRGHKVTVRMTPLFGDLTNSVL